jgi:hypothetical protein
LEGFRTVVAKVKSDVIFCTVLKPTHFDLFIFDRRVPYHVFYHTEVHPENESGVVALTEELVTEQSRVLMRRGLYLYLTNQFYELPREKRQLVMETQIPRWIASAEMVQSANRDFISRLYVSTSVGGALAMASDERSWAGSVLGIQIGVRPFGSWYAEFAYEAFAYNAFLASAKYALTNKYSSVHVLAGLGGAFLTNRKSMDYDRNMTLHKVYYFVVPSMTVFFPLADVYFKAEMQGMVSVSDARFVFNFLPGLMFLF